MGDHLPSITSTALVNPEPAMVPPSPTQLLFVSFLLFFLSTMGAHAKVPPSQRFTYVNQGEFGPYGTEYGASYRLLPIAISPFQLCFYNTTPGAFYLGLRVATLRSESTLRWVWDANQVHPVGDNATLSLLPSGDLVLADADGRVVWSTGTANKGVVGLRILPNGNLVLYDGRGRFVWQSFDHPSDTLLVGQFLRVGGTTKLVSHVPDGSFGIYSLVMEPGGLVMYMYINNATTKPLPYHHYSDWLLRAYGGNLDSVKLECEPETEEAFVYEVTLEVTAKLGNSSNTVTNILARPKYNATLSFLRLQPDGNLVVYTYYDPVDYRAWERTFALFSEESGWVSGCALPSKCGALGLCEDEMCVACPTAKGLLGWSKGCQPPELGACGSGATVDYYKVVGVENFLTSYVQGEEGVKVEVCRMRCSAECGCKGFMYWQEESKCWLAPLLGTLTKVSNSSHIAYIKYSK